MILSGAKKIYTNSSESDNGSTNLIDINNILKDLEYTKEPIRTGVKGERHIFSEILSRFKKGNILEKLKLLKDSEQTFELLKKILGFALCEINEGKTVSINLYLADFGHPDFIEVINILSKNLNGKNSNLIFEIIEEPYGELNEDVIANLKYIESKGFGIAIDDFTPNIDEDNISLEIVNTLILNGIIPDYIKIDGKYVQEILNGKIGQKEKLLFSTTITSFKSQGIKIIGEWITDNEEGTRASKFGFDGFQGRDLDDNFEIEKEPPRLKNFRVYTKPGIRSFGLYDDAKGSFRLNPKLVSFRIEKEKESKDIPQIPLSELLEDTKFRVSGLLEQI